MYVCICKGITEKQLEDAYQKHKGNVKVVLKSLGVGSDCGSCVEEACNNLKRTDKQFESKDHPRIK